MEKQNSCLDMLVKLYALPDRVDLRDKNFTIRQAMILDKTPLLSWVRETFGQGWADEAAMSFCGHPIRCFIATKDKNITGFAVYDAARPGFFGPVGVEASAQNRGVGKALTIETLHHMNAQGYAYAVIGWVAPQTQEYFQKILKAESIPGSDPMTSAYKGV